MRCAITATLFYVLLAFSAAGETSHGTHSSWPRLADVLQREVPNASVPPVDVEAAITSYGSLNDTSYFTLGYYVDNQRDPNALTPPLRVLLLNKQSNSWRYLEIQGKADAEDPKNICLGSVLRIKTIKGKFFIETHLSPSSSCQFVLSRTLNLEHILFGWPNEVPSSRRLLVVGNTAHFAMTHPLRLSMYDPATATETQLLPQDNDRAMKWIDKDLADLIDESWCQENNSPCEASGLGGVAVDVFANDQSNAVAMHVQYVGDGMGPKAQNFKADVIYVFDLRDKTIQHREFKPDAVQKMIGKYDMEKLTQPAVLRRLFSQRALR